MERLPEEALTSPSLDLDFLRDLIALVEREDLAELTVSWGEVSITVRRQRLTPSLAAPSLMPSLPASPSPTPQRQRAKTPPKEVAVTDERLFRITAPLTGVFYSRPRLDAPPFISVGSPIEPGQVVALVEAMKFFNEVRSEVGGVVREIVAKDGQLVRHGDTLIIVERKD
jgi:acetyl-CoA carboxylase biotin carboxyl carrier protein